jgi:hypothetical protein
VRQEVAGCPQNCWMVSSAKTAIRNRHVAALPKVSVMRWVLWNKLKLTFGGKIAFDKYIDYGNVRRDTPLVPRRSYLGVAEKKVLQPETSRRYSQLDGYFNR